METGGLMCWKRQPAPKRHPPGDLSNLHRLSAEPSREIDAGWVASLVLVVTGAAAGEAGAALSVVGTAAGAAAGAGADVAAERVASSAET